MIKIHIKYKINKSLELISSVKAVPAINHSIDKLSKHPTFDCYEFWQKYS